MKKRKIDIIPGVNVQSFEELKKAVSSVEPYSDWIHLDVADGTFTKNTLWHNAFDLASLETALKLEIHLMILNPEERINDWITEKVKRIIFNLESSKSPNTIIKKCRENNIEVGISIGPDTSLAKLHSYLDKIDPVRNTFFQTLLKRFFTKSIGGKVSNGVDVVQILSVYPGLSGQKFIQDSLEKIRALNSNFRKYKIEVDGGMNYETAKLVKDAGADIIVSVSYIFSGDIKERINKLKSI